MKTGYKIKSLLFAPVTAALLLAFTAVSANDTTEVVKLIPLGLPSQDLIMPVGLSTKVSLDVRNIDIVEALKFLSMKSGMNIIPTQKVSGRVTLRVENVTVKDIFDIMLRSNSLAYDKQGEIYNVMTEVEYKSLYGKNFTDTRKVKVFRLKYAVPNQAFSLLEAVKSDIGRLLVEPDSGTVMIMDTPEKIKEAQEALRSLEQKGVMKVFTLKYAQAQDIEEQLKNQLEVKGVGTVKSDTRNNQVIVHTLPDRMKDIESLVHSLDKKTKDVLIDTRIIQIRLSNQLDTGVQWEGLFGFLQREGIAYLGSYPYSAVQAATDLWRSRTQVLGDMNKNIGSYPFSGTTSNYSGGSKVSPGQALHVGMIMNNQDFDVLIKYLQTIGKTKILSNPSLSVINNQEAKIHIGERRAYITTTTTQTATTTAVSEAVNFVDVGIMLSVTPTINDDGYVTIKIKPEISSVTGSLVTPTDNVIPIIDKSMAETTVIVKNGATIMLAGLGREEKTESHEGIPFLSKIPFLGVLFRSSSKATVRTELLVLLTPYIYEGDTLITPNQRDIELHGIKKAKKFDVFRQDVRAENIPPAGETMQKLAMSKGLKTYQGEVRSGNFLAVADKKVFVREDVMPQDSSEQDKAGSSDTETALTTKGFKGYENKPQDYGAVAVKETIKEEKVYAPKDFRPDSDF
ncbi:MAG: secretin N-terminal domain-containing protein [Candidatus Omnitrophota bacterium]